MQSFAALFSLIYVRELKSAVRQRDVLNPVLASLAATIVAVALNVGIAAAGCGSAGGLEVGPLEAPASLAGTAPDAASAAPDTSKLPQPGDVLIAGGIGSNGQTIGSAQFYSASLGSFVSTPAMGTTRAAHSALMFPAQNVVLLVGGFTGKAKPTGSSIVFHFITQATGRIYHTNKGTFGTYGPVKDKMKSGNSDDDRAFFPAVTLPSSGWGFFPSGLCNGDLRPTAFDYDSGLNMFQQFLPNPVVTTRAFHTATVLTTGPDAGQVLITGGMVDFGGDTTKTAEIFDPTTGISTATANPMNDSRAGQTATLLSDGTVLIAGGATGVGGTWTSLNTAEIYDPTKGTFTCIGGTLGGGGCKPSMQAARWQHTATLLGNGNVLIAGGFDGSASWTLAPFGKGAGDAGTWTPTGTIENTAEVYDPTGQTFTATGPMTAARFGHTATLLTTGTDAGDVLIVGGFGGSNPGAPLNSTELSDPTGGTFTAGPSLKAARAWHTATQIQAPVS